jgi:site-specific recombinase XerD
LAESTIQKEERFLRTWFDEHGQSHRPLYVWEAMDAQTGREILVDYSKALLETDLTTHTVRAYLGILRRFFAYVLEHPLVMTSKTSAIRIQERYGVMLTQPVSEFDMPRYVYEGEQAGIPMDPERLYEFFGLLRKHYITDPSGQEAVRHRNYAMAVLAGETGLRVDELVHLEVDRDLFFDSKKVQTRHAKASKGSGKRSRITLFPPLARDTMKFYIANARCRLATPSTLWLFPSKTGRRLDYSAAYTAIKDMVAVASMHDFPVADHMCWHWLRRIFATTFIERNPGKMAVLIELLGHMSPNTVHRYIRHSSAWMDRQIQEVLEGASSWPSIGS